MSRRIRIRAKRRAEVDVDKLVFALLQVLEARGREANERAPRTRPRRKSESAA